MEAEESYCPILERRLGVALRLAARESKQFKGGGPARAKNRHSENDTRADVITVLTSDLRTAFCLNMMPVCIHLVIYFPLWRQQVTVLFDL